MSDKIKILLIEDELPIRKFLKSGLGEAYNLIEATSGQEGLSAIATHNPKLVILDLGLPDMDGLEVTKQAREFTDIPIIVLSARGQDLDKISALDSGADDYLTKPFSLDELLARMRVAMRHAEKSTKPKEIVFESNGLKIDFPSREVFLDQEKIHLTPIEYQLLTCLVRDAGRVLTHNQLLTEVWGAAYSKETQYLRVFMRQLRQKLKEKTGHSRFITTEPGVGYRFKAE